ncbi:MAG: Maf-like protein YceF [Oligoflexia bacterium]|nr:MAG: Maf-like protein YceF [Oligoflexia bacterium]
MHQDIFKLVLASESPRRKSLLSEAGFQFTVFPVKVSENLEKNLNVDDQIISIARRKAVAAFDQYKLLNLHNYLILTADTMVVEGNEPLGKPENPNEAFQILRRLSGKKHQVKTAICLVVEQPCQKDQQNNPHFICDIETTDVFFKTLTDQEIEDYIKTGEPMDKAGAYGIQGLGGKFVEKIVGPYDNVVGLPIGLLQKMLKENNWQVK